MTIVLVILYYNTVIYCITYWSPVTGLVVLAIIIVINLLICRLKVADLCLYL